MLRSLKTAPYEPLNSASERFVGLKALFLLALASMKRVGELHGLSFRVSHNSGWKEMSFDFVPGFVAKTQDPSTSDSRFEGFSIPALPRRGHDQDARLLCPVRALRRYLDMTAACRPFCERLFVSTGKSRREISKNSISHWIRRWTRTVARKMVCRQLSCPGNVAMLGLDIRVLPPCRVLA